MDLVDVIKIKYDELTSSEKKIADYIFKDSEGFLSFNAKKIGEVTETSAATVIRFCKKINVDSLETLKVEIARRNVHNTSTNEIDPILKDGDNIEEISTKIYFQADTSLKKTLSLIDFHNLGEIVEELKKAENIYIYGIGASSLAAYDLYHKLNRINKRAFYNFDGHMNLELSVHAGPRDVAIAFSYGGNAIEINKAIERVKKNGTKTIGVVKVGETILGKLVDYRLKIPNNEKRVRMGALSSKFAQMLYVDMLYFGIASENLDEVMEHLMETSDVVSPLKTL